jgi:hypothetical protein
MLLVGMDRMSFMTGRNMPAHRHWPAFAFVLLALLLRTAIPTGYMLGTDASGSIMVEPCSGQATAMPMRHGANHHDHGQKSEMPCPFGVLGAPAMPSAPPVVAAASVAVVPAPNSFLLPTRLLPGPAAPPPPSTGPPARL